MNRPIRDLERIVESMRGPVRDYAEQVWELGGENVLSITLFGSIVAGTFDPARHTVRNAVVLDKVDLGMLRELSLRGARLGKARIAAPLIMTPDYIKASLDSFPLELIEIRQLHLTVAGEDQFDGIAFEDNHVRLQCERELKSLLIGMRQGLLASAGSEKLLGAVDGEVAERLIRTLRGFLWLKGQKEGRPYPQVLSTIEGELGRKLDGVRAALDPAGRRGWEDFQVLYHDVEAVSVHVESH